MSKKTFHVDIKRQNFSYIHTREPAPENKAFVLHNHNDNFETLIFLDGDAEFYVEGSVYTPKPGDIIIASCHEMHRMYMKSSAIYDRIVINADYGFFSMHPSLKNVFTSRKLGQGNVLKITDQQRNIIIDNCNRIEYYYNNFNSETNNQIIDNLLLEIMYTINQSNHSKDTVRSSDERIKKILMYINDNLTSRLTLENISSKFFINKYHLCRIFKTTTGMTINRYINYKRILLAKELHSGGKNFTDASLDAGFENYATFYSVYKREMGHSPRNDPSNKI